MATDNGGADIETSDDNEFSSGRGGGGRKYRPVFSHDQDRAVLKMSSIDPSSGASSTDSFSSRSDLRNIKVGVQANMSSEGQDGSVPNHEGANGSQTESKLELFGFDSLVNILGLRSMARDQIPAPSSPQDGEDVTINLDRPKISVVRLGTMMGVFVPLQNILGIIYYIRFS